MNISGHHPASLARLLLMLCCLIAWPAFLAAQVEPADPHAAQPERPTVATHAGTVAPGWVEIEAGSEFDRYEDHSTGASAPLLAKLGLAPRLQLSVQIPIASPPQTDHARVGDLFVGTKWRLIERGPVFGNFAILPSVKFPTGSADWNAGTGTTDVGLLLISSHDFGPVGMDVNVGYTRRSGNGTKAPRNATLWTCSFGGTAYKRIGWTAEIYGYPHTTGPAGSPSIIAFLGGPTLQARKWLIFDAGIIAPITGPQPRAFYAGFVYNIGRIWE